MLVASSISYYLCVTNHLIIPSLSMSPNPRRQILALVKLSAFGLLLIAPFASCHKEIANGMLTQKGILKEWWYTLERDTIRGTLASYTNPEESVWMLGEDMPVSKKEIMNKTDNCFGNTRFFWKYKIKGLPEVFYLNTCGGPVFPVSSLGTDISIQNIVSPMGLVAEDIYMVTDTTVVVYDKEQLNDVGWTDYGKGRYRFRIPKNDSGKIRFWSVMMFAPHREYYDNETTDSGKFEREWFRNKRWPVTRLYFIQVTDTVTSKMINYDRRTYTSLFSDATKWLPDPEGGYKFDRQ